MRRLACLMLLVVCSAWGQGIVINGPTDPLSPKDYAFIPFSGISVDELKSAMITVEPPSGVQAFRISESLLIVVVDKTATPGKRTLTIGLNMWRQPIYVALAAAKEAKADQAVIAALENANKAAEPYPLKSGTCTLEVAGTVPFPDPNHPGPQPPLPPTTKVTRVTYIWEKDLSSVPRPVASALNRLNAGGSSGVAAEEFEEDTVNGLGQTPSQYVIALKAAREAGLPALVVQAGDVVLRVVKAPTTEAQVLEAAK